LSIAREGGELLKNYGAVRRSREKKGVVQSIRGARGRSRVAKTRHQKTAAKMKNKLRKKGKRAGRFGTIFGGEESQRLERKRKV